MTDKIETLTPEQEKELIPFRDKWLKIGLSTKTVDREKSTKAIQNLYLAAGQDKPIVMHFDSPAQCIMAYHFLKNVGDINGANLWDNLGANLRDNLRANLRANLRDNLWDNLGDNLGANLRANLWDNLGANLRANLWDNLGANLRANLGDNLGANLDYVPTYFWGGMDAYWLAFYEFGEKIGVKYEKSDHFHAYIEYAKSSGVGYFYPNIALVSDRPETILKDDQNRLHCEDGPAVRYRDGYSIYAFEGKNVPTEWIENKNTIDPSEIIKAENVELRSVGARIIGWPRMLEVLDAKTIDSGSSDDIGQLIELTLPGLSKPGRFLKAVCPRNGVIVEGVPYKSDIDGLPIETALAAQAWRIGDPQSEYQHPEKRT